MAPENKTPSLQMQISKPNKAFEPHPELLIAARLGDWERLERLLSMEEDAALAAPQLVIPIEEVVADVDADAEDVDIMSAPAEAATASRDSLLHVVASRGDGEEFLKSASVIYSKASHLLDVRNKNGDTPLHCAAQAAWGAMVSHLVSLARGAENGEKVKALLRVQNGRGETVLHEAVRLGDRDMIGRLMAEDPQLARVPPADGASPLYLAVELGHNDIARQLHENDQALSYSGRLDLTAEMPYM